MELSDLRIFVAVVENGGISHAALKLHRVPSNVTARIKKLERDLGKTLFIRDKNRLRISPAGKQLLPYANKLLMLAQTTVDELTDCDPKGKLRLGSMEAAAATRLVEPLMKFHHQYPQVELEVNIAPTGESINKVLSGELDMALVSDPQQDSRLVTRPVFNETLVIVSDLAHQPIHSPQDLATNPTLLGFSSSCAYRTRLTEWVKDEGDFIKVIEINSYHTLLSCVAAGMGVGIVPQALLDNYPFSSSIQVHQLPQDRQQSITSFIWRKDSTKPSIEAFLDGVSSHFKMSGV